jgi:hypothetical protein
MPCGRRRKPLIPVAPPDEHPLGCHRRRVPDRICFQGIPVRLLVTGRAWVHVERLLDGGVGHDAACPSR